MRVVVRRETERDLIAAAQYYESCRPGLGAAFLDEAERAFTDLAQFPARWRMGRAAVRRDLLARFPNGFFYWEKRAGEELEILSVSPASATRATGAVGTSSPLTKSRLHDGHINFRNQPPLHRPSRNHRDVLPKKLQAVVCR